MRQRLQGSRKRRSWGKMDSRSAVRAFRRGVKQALTQWCYQVPPDYETDGQPQLKGIRIRKVEKIKRKLARGTLDSRKAIKRTDEILLASGVL